MGQGSWEDTSAQFLSAVQLDFSVYFWSAVLAGASTGCEVLAGKGGWCLYTLRGFNRQGRKLDGCRSKAHSSRKMDEARLLKKMAKCDISETCENMIGLDCDHTWTLSDTT